MIKLTTTREIKPFVNTCIYGESGVGKTQLCSTVDAPLIISAEGGLLTLHNKDIPVFEIHGKKECNEVYDWLAGSNESSQYKTICIDSLSEIAEVLLAEEKANTKDARQAYGVMNDEMAILIRGFRDIKKDVYFTCKQKRLVNDTTQAVNFIPSVPGNSLLQSLPYFFDELFVMRIGVLEDGSSYRFIQTVKDRQYEAKDRSGSLKPVIEPHLGKIIDTIKVAMQPQKGE